MGCCQLYCSCCGTAFIVRTFHALLVLGVAASLLFKNSLLHQCFVNGDHLLFGAAYTVLLIWALSMYYLTCFTDPGYVVKPHGKKTQIKTYEDSEDEDDENGTHETQVFRLPSSYCGDGVDDENLDVKDQMLPQHSKGGMKYRVCDYCEISQPMRVKHCEDCNRCVRKFDHHCPWLEACIGERNHRYFWWFLFSTMILIFVTFYIAWNAFEYKLWWSDWLKTNVLLFIDIFVLFFGGLIVLGLWCFHSFLMTKGLTTWEAASRERITYLKYLDEDFNPFNEGLCRNLFHFLCACHLQKWEKVYARKAHSSV